MNALARVRAAAARATSWVTSWGTAFNALQLRGRHQDPPIRGTADFLATYSTNPWVRGIAGKVAGDVGSTTWALVRTDTMKPVTDHLMLKVLRKPNPVMSGRALIRVTNLCLDLVGNAYWLFERNGLGAPIRYWPIPPHWVQSTPAMDSPFYGISYGDFQAQVPMSEIAPFGDLDPFNPYLRGAGIIRALGDEVETDEYAAKHAKQLFFNRATPEYVVMDVGAKEAELRVHERAWIQRLSGFWKAMQPYFVNRELKFWQPTQQNLENLTLVPLRTFERDIQLQCWGVPPEQLGIVENSNRATAEASDYIYQDRVIKPRRELMAEELTLHVASAYDDRLQVIFKDTTPRDKDFRLAAVRAAPYAFTIDEIRELTGDLPMPNGKGKAVAVPLFVYVTDDPTDPAKRPQAGGFGQRQGDDKPPKPEGGEGAEGEEGEGKPPKPAPPKPKKLLELAAGGRN